MMEGIVQAKGLDSIKVNPFQGSDDLNIYVPDLIKKDTFI